MSIDLRPTTCLDATLNSLWDAAIPYIACYVCSPHLCLSYKDQTRYNNRRILVEISIVVKLMS